MNHEPLQMALEAGGVGTWVWDRASGVVVWNVTTEKLYDVDSTSFDGSLSAWVDLIHPEDRPETVRIVHEALVAKGSFTVEHRVTRRDETIRWLRVKGRVIDHGDGGVTGTTGCIWDVTEQVAIANDRQQAIAELERAAERDRAANDRLEFLARVNEVLAVADRQEDIVKLAAFAAVPRLGDWCVLAVLPEDGGAVPTIEVANADPEMVAYARQLQERFPYDPEATTGMPQVIRTATPEFIPSIDDEILAAMDTTDEARAVAQELQLRSSIIVPLKKRGKVLGAMQFVNSSNRRVYTTHDVVLAEAVASRIASALVNRQITEKLRRDEFRAALDAMVDNVAIAKAIRDDGGEIVDFTIVFMNAASRDGAGRGAAELTGARLLDAYPGLKESGLFARYVRVVEDGEPLILERVRYEDASPQRETIDGWWSLRVVRFDDGYLVSSRDETANVLAEIELEETRRAEARTRIALEVLQTAALPTELPSIDGLEFGVRYEPAARGLPVGGDWFDIFEIPSRNAVGVVVADVAGHGPDSAGVMVQVRNSLRAYAVEGYDPDEVLRRSNEMLYSSSGEPRFVTCTYLLIEPEQLTAHWSCAGHFPPVLARSKEVDFVESTVGIPMGVERAARYESSVMKLISRDTVLLFTDGLVERRGEVIEDGLARLRELLSARRSDPAQTLVDRLVEGLVPEGDRNDDIAIVGIQVVDGPTS